MADSFERPLIPGSPAELAESAGVGLEEVRYEDVPLTPIHVSGVELMTTGNDVTLVFSYGRPAYAIAGDQRHMVARLDAAAILVMSPGTAKDLAQALNGIVQQLEAQFGSIETPFTKARREAGA